MNKYVTEKPLYIVANYIYAFFMTNLYFLIANLLFFFVYFSIELTAGLVWILFISLIPVGPAIGALLYNMGKLVREKEISPTRDFFKGYVKNFKISVLFWLIQLVFFMVLITNLRQTELELQPILAIFYFILVFFLFLVSCYGFAILSRFEVTLKNLYIISAYYVFKYWKRTLLNLGGAIFSLLLFIQFPIFATLFLASGVGWALMSNLKAILADMEDGQI